MLRRYIVLPAILLALGVGDASAMKCRVNVVEGIFFRSSANALPEDDSSQDNRLCIFLNNYEFDADSSRLTVRDKTFVKATVPKNDQKIFCRRFVNESDNISGYVVEIDSKDGPTLIRCR